ncbi:hypothetical protein K0H71_00370 [Bacillus sp. IITD106]|nr:hypothetical protein [Bacillus sp. IITD106]
MSISFAITAIGEARMDDHLSITTALAEIYKGPWQEGKETKRALTRIKRLDQMTNGFQAGELTVIAAKQSMLCRIALFSKKKLEQIK